MKENTEIQKFQKEFDVVVSKLLMSKIFLPIGLHLMNYKCVFIKLSEVPAQLQGAPAYTDFERIYIAYDSPFYSDKNSFMSTLMYVAIHEDLHILLEEKSRLGSRDPELWWIACDYVINLLIRNLQNESYHAEPRLIQMPIQKMEATCLVSDSFTNLIEEEVYQRLQSTSFKKKKTVISLKEFLSTVGVPDDGTSSDEQIEVTEVEFEYENKKKKTVQVKFPDVKDSQRQTDRSEQNTLARSMLENNLLTRGLNSSSFQGFLKRLFKVKVNWKTILADTVHTELQKSPELIWGHPRMSWLANPTLPYLTNFSEEELLGTVVFLIDESGSVPNEDVARAAEIVFQSREYFKNFYVIKHDSEVRWKKMYETLDLDEIKELLVRRHCGGTSHKGPFEECAAFMKESSDNKISLIISLTDLASDIETTQNILPSTIPRIYLVGPGISQLKKSTNSTGKILNSTTIIGKIIEVL